MTFARNILIVLAIQNVEVLLELGRRRRRSDQFGGRGGKIPLSALTSAETDVYWVKDERSLTFTLVGTNDQRSAAFLLLVGEEMHFGDIISTFKFEIATAGREARKSHEVVSGLIEYSGRVLQLRVCSNESHDSASNHADHELLLRD